MAFHLKGAKAKKKKKDSLKRTINLKLHIDKLKRGNDEVHGCRSSGRERNTYGGVTASVVAGRRAVGLGGDSTS